MTGRPAFDGVTLFIDGTKLGIALRAGIAGRVLRSHPSRGDLLARPGQVVRAGATVALIAVGPVLVPVTMPEDGLVLSLAAADGRAVGYGDTLATIVPLAELASMGIAS